MALENRNLEIGDRLVATYKKERYICTVAAGDDGEGISFVLEDGSKFGSPSAAASAVMNGTAANGWRFWSLDSGELPAVLEASPKPHEAKVVKAKKIISRAPNQQAVEPGQVRWFCAACMKSFYRPEGEQPEVCPEGHRTDDTGL